MPSFESVRVAAVQGTSVIPSPAASIEKAGSLTVEAAGRGGQPILLPEGGFVSLYPSKVWAYPGRPYGSSDGLKPRFTELWERMWAEAIGVNAPGSERPGTMHNTLVLIGPEGILNRHRTLRPTMHERLIHGDGTGDDLTAVDTLVGEHRQADLLGASPAAGGRAVYRTRLGVTEASQNQSERRRRRRHVGGLSDHAQA